MRLNEHGKLKGQHSFLSASNYHWLNYDEEKLVNTFRRQVAAMQGTKLHELAAFMIDMGVKSEGNDTFSQYVNDAIGFRMTPEQVLFYSPNCFGTADAISFRQTHLRIHDLKTGTSRTSMNQLMIYTALFCHEYHVKPTDIDVTLRIYQNDEITEYEPTYDRILEVMERIVWADKTLTDLKEELR